MTLELDKAEQAPGAVKRFSNPWDEQNHMTLDKKGPYVRYSDYAAKEAECEALRVEVERWAEQANKEDECRQTWQARCEAAEKDLAATQEANDINIGAWRVQREAADAKLKRIRAETIEECAKVAGRMLRQYDDMDGPRQTVVAAIRALASEDSAE